MARLFTKSNSDAEAGIIAREEVLMPEFFPDELMHRETELHFIADAINPLVEDRQGENLFIHGDSGTGKTTCIKHVLKELEDHTSRVVPVYANCWLHSTRMAVYSLIVQALKEVLPRRGLATDEVFSRIVEVMGKSNVRVLVVLDEMDGLFFHNEEKLLYELARAGEGKPFFGIIGISNDAYLLSGKDMRVKSSLRFTDFEFKHYNAEQMNSVLSERAKIGLIPGSWDKDVIGACAQKAIESQSNVRVGLEFLWKAAKRAEKAGKKKITVEDVEAVEGKSLYEFGLSKRPEECSFEVRSKSLSEEERFLLEILKNGEKSSSELYAEFTKKMIRTKRQIRNYLKALEAKKLIVLEDVPGTNPMLSTKKIHLSFRGEKK